ncbi:MAG: beta-propeller fold lactonase family protein [Terracidiphilus sp.]|nr:beta-propeller fold lactonase family protein [Terracidiphilus sp.]
MKFTKFGKALLMGALSVGVVLGITSCVQSYSVGYLYVTGTVTAQTTGAGIVSGFKIDHNTGKLTAINGLPVSSGGANPVRAVLTGQSRFIYVLNRGVNASGGSICTSPGTSPGPCQNSNITQFAVGGNGVLTAQETFYTQGVNPFRMMVDGTGTYLLVLDHDSPDNSSPSSTDGCANALNGVTTCGDVTVFQINQTTGRLSLVVNSQVTSATGQKLTYFPVPANPVDFALAGSYLLTLNGSSFSYNASTAAYNGGTSVFPYSYSTSTGQLTVTSNSSQQLGITQGNSLFYTFNVLYVLANDPITLTFNGVSTVAQSQILPYTVGSTGSLQAEASGTVPDDPTLANPIALLEESKGTHIYVANQGNNVSGSNAQSGISGYFITANPYQLSFISGEPFGSGAGPQCIVEDPSNQFLYEANFNDSTIYGRVIDPNSGVLNDMRKTNTFVVQGPPTWCLVDGRTS